MINATGLDPPSVQLRADRLGTEANRLYDLTATAADLAGNTAIATATRPLRRAARSAAVETD